MLRFFPLLFALLASPAGAEPMAAVRARHEAAVVRVEGILEEQARLRAAHEALARQIAELKAGDRAVLPGVTGGQLDGLLKEAHELATRLEEQDRRVAEAAQVEETERTRLLAAVDEALAAESEAQLARPDADRRAAFERMKTLMAERGRLVARATAERRVIELPVVGEEASPDELRALADEASDNSERVKSQLTALEERLQALQTRRRVLRAAVAFERDAALFNEDERNRRLVRAEQPVVGVATPRPGTKDTQIGEGEPTGDEENTAAPPPAAPEAGGGEFDGDGRDNEAPGEADDDGLAADPGVLPDPVPTGVVAPGPAGVEGGGSVVVETALDPALLADDVEALSPAAVADQIRAIERRRAALKKTATELEKRRSTLEKRARDLEVE